MHKLMGDSQTEISEDMGISETLITYLGKSSVAGIFGSIILVLGGTAVNCG